MTRQKQKNTRVHWKYCECGCHGHELRLGPVYYWLFDDLGKGGGSKKRLFHLNTGHSGLGKYLGSYASFDAADRAARKLAKGVLKKHRAELDRAEAGLR